MRGLHELMRGARTRPVAEGRHGLASLGRRPHPGWEVRCCQIHFLGSLEPPVGLVNSGDNLCPVGGPPPEACRVHGAAGSAQCCR